MKYSILDGEGKVVKELPSREHEALNRREVRETKNGEATSDFEGQASRFSAVEVGAVNVVALTPGQYEIQVQVKDLTTEEKALSSKRFTLIQERSPLSDQEALEWEIPEWTKEYYTQIQYIATQKEFSFYKSLSSEGKKEYLDRFWNKRDPVPQTLENEGFIAFAKRIREADSLFTSAFEKGRKTDRGRIYIKYGPPDHRERRPTDVSYKPHETWSYYGRGGMQFVFLDFSGFGQYEIIYSTEEGEFTHPKWFEMIDPTEVEQRRR